MEELILKLSQRTIWKRK